MLLTGEPGTALDVLGLNALTAQTANGSGVRCVYGAVGASAADAGAGVEAALSDGRGRLAPPSSLARQTRPWRNGTRRRARRSPSPRRRARGRGRASGAGRFHRFGGFPRGMARLSRSSNGGRHRGGDGGVRGDDHQRASRGAPAILGMTLQRVARERRTRRGEPHAPRGDVPRARRTREDGGAKNSGAVGETAGGDAAPGLPAGSTT